MENIQEKLILIKNAILRSVSAKKIYLFGSYVYGNPNEKSDIDIYAVIPDNFEREITDTMGEIGIYLYNKNIKNCDLFLVKEKRFNHYFENSSFEKTIVNKGILIYGN
ncbi:nucleotidyltransferase domain-containing protein [Treponema sp. R80B11-R83G3]